MLSREQKNPLYNYKILSTYTTHLLLVDQKTGSKAIYKEFLIPSSQNFEKFYQHLNQRKQINSPTVLQLHMFLLDSQSLIQTQKNENPPLKFGMLFESPIKDFQQEITKRISLKQYWTEEEIINTMELVFEGLMEFHQCGMIHGNFRAKSIVFCEDRNVKIGDNFLWEKNYWAQQDQNKEGYWQPGGGVSREGDLWAAGVIFLEAASLQQGEDIYNNGDINFQLLNQRIEQLNNIYSVRLIQLLNCLLSYDPNERKNIYKQLGIQSEPILRSQDQINLNPITHLQQEELQPQSLQFESEQQSVNDSNVQNEFESERPQEDEEQSYQQKQEIQLNQSTHSNSPFNMIKNAKNEYDTNQQIEQIQQQLDMNRVNNFQRDPQEFDTKSIEQMLGMEASPKNENNGGQDLSFRSSQSQQSYKQKSFYDNKSVSSQNKEILTNDKLKWMDDIVKRSSSLVQYGQCLQKWEKQFQKKNIFLLKKHFQIKKYFFFLNFFQIFFRHSLQIKNEMFMRKNQNHKQSTDYNCKSQTDRLIPTPKKMSESNISSQYSHRLQENKMSYQQQEYQNRQNDSFQKTENTVNFKDNSESRLSIYQEINKTNNSDQNYQNIPEISPISKRQQQNGEIYSLHSKQSNLNSLISECLEKSQKILQKITPYIISPYQSYKQSPQHTVQEDPKIFDTKVKNLIQFESSSIEKQDSGMKKSDLSASLLQRSPISAHKGQENLVLADLFEKSVNRSKALIEKTQKNINNVQQPNQERQEKQMKESQDQKQFESEILYGGKENLVQQKRSKSQICDILLSKKIKNTVRLEYTGGYYKGQVVNGKRHGLGYLYDSNDQLIYYGEWMNDLQNGYGILYNMDLKGQSLNEIQVNYQDFNMSSYLWYKYEGNFELGYKQGAGYQQYLTGDSFTGQFNNGKINGQGCFNSLGNHTLLGQWNNNQLVKQI